MTDIPVELALNSQRGSSPGNGLPIGSAPGIGPTREPLEFSRSPGEELSHTRLLSIDLLCLEIGQDSEANQGYVDIIPHDDSEPGIKEIQAPVCDLHRRISARPLKSEAVIYFPLNTLAFEHSLFCLCRCVEAAAGTAQPFLRLQAVIGSRSQLSRAGADPLAIYHSDIWNRLERERLPSCRVSPAAGMAQIPRLHPDEGLVDRIAAALTRCEPYSLFLDGVDYRQAIAMTQQALAQMDHQGRIATAFAIGLPEGINLPDRPVMLIPRSLPEKLLDRVLDRPPERATVAEPGATSSQPRPEPVRSAPTVALASAPYPQYLEQVARRLESSDRLTLFQRQRLWNRCEDLILLAEDARSEAHEDDRSQVLYYSALLVRELARWGITDEGPLLEERTRQFCSELPDLSADVSPDMSRELAPETPASISLDASPGEFMGDDLEPGTGPNWGLIIGAALVLVLVGVLFYFLAVADMSHHHL